MCHTPMKALKDKFEDQLVIISGVGEITNVMENYGFKKFLTTEEYCVHFPQLLSHFFHEKE